MSNGLKNLLKDLIILVIVSLMAYFFSYHMGELYGRLINSGSTFVDLTGLIGIPLSYIFFLTLLFTAFGGAKKYWWIGILLIPAALFEAYFDLPHIYFPAILGIIGWSLGFLLFKIVNRVKIV